MAMIKNVSIGKFNLRLNQDSVQIFEYMTNPKLHFGEAIQTSIAYTKYSDCGTAENEFEKLVKLYRTTIK